MTNNIDFYNIFNSSDVFVCANNLKNTIRKIEKTDLPEPILKNFKEQVIQHIASNAIFSKLLTGDLFYSIYENKEALQNYCAIIILGNIQECKGKNDILFLKNSLSTIKSLKKSETNMISKSVLDKILKFLDSQYFIRQKIEGLNVNLLDYTNPAVDGLTIHNCINEVNHIPIFLFRTIKTQTDPIHVLLHEIGHLIHILFYIKFPDFYLPEMFIKSANKILNRKMDEIPLQHQAEIFADLISLGMVYKTPYEKHHEYNFLSDINKEKLHTAFCEIMNKL